MPKSLLENGLWYLISSLLIVISDPNAALKIPPHPLHAYQKYKLAAVLTKILSHKDPSAHCSAPPIP